MRDVSGHSAGVEWSVNDEGIGRIVIDRPAVRNALNDDSWQAIAEAVGVLESHATAVVVSGSNGHFSAGMDLKTPRRLPEGVVGLESGLRRVNSAVRALRSLPIPTVAAVEGAAVGAGMALAVACDIVVCAENGFFAPPRVDHGLVPDVGVAWTLVRALGYQRAAALVFLGGAIAGTDAVDAGLAKEVVSNGTALDRALDTAGRLAALPRDTAKLAKSILRTAEDSSWEHVLAAEGSIVSLNSLSPPARAASQAFFGRAER